MAAKAAPETAGAITILRPDKEICYIPHVAAPTEKNAKRRAWDSKKVYEVLESITDDRLLHPELRRQIVERLLMGALGAERSA